MRYLGCLFALMSLPLSGQNVYDFENDSLSGWLQLPGGRWKPSSSDPISGEGSLHHTFDNPASGVDQISRELQYPDLSDTLSVAFRVRHSYPPSSGNNWQLFFLSSAISLSDENMTLNSAIIFGVNYSGYDDHLKLWQLVNGNAIEVLDSGLDYQEQIGTAGQPLFRITRYPGGRWKVAWQQKGDPDSLQFIGEGIEIEPQKGKYFGFRYAYSSSQDRKLWVDDISVGGRFFQDTIPPWITGVRILGLNGLEIRYSEPVRQADQLRFRWDLSEPDSVFLSPDMHRIYFRQSFPNRKAMELSVSGILDLENNALRDTVLQFRQDLAAFGDVVINEIMTDPDPRVYLPSCEYVELFNRYDQPINLGGWHLHVKNREYDIQATALQPGEYLLLTHPDCNGNYGSVEQQAVLTSSTALINGGAVLQLTDRYGRLIHSLEYEAMDRYGDGNVDGGWSLERIDPDNLCGSAENWQICENRKGGTPGKMNSHHHEVPDFRPPDLVSVGIPSESGNKIIIRFNETIRINHGDNSRFLLDDHQLKPEKGPATFAGKEIQLVLNHPLDTSMLYQLALENISDCAGNVAEDQRIPLMLPSAPAKGIPVINEIMYDPAFGWSEYIELYNQDDRYYDIYDLQLELREPGALRGTKIPLSEKSRLLFPGQYVVLCRHDYALVREWNTGDEAVVIRVNGWKQLVDAGACIRLTDRSGKVLDQVCYHDSMHLDQLQITSGVSLERIAPDCGTGSQCWTSAAASENYGTPGRRNSQTRSQRTDLTGAEIILTPKVISPDGDGVDDYLQIAFSRIAKGDLVDIYVTDLTGNHVRQIVSMGITGQRDHFYWDGKDQQGRIVLPGIYIIHQRLISTTGNRIRRASCAVVYK
jgi:hypothetical protein